LTEEVLREVAAGAGFAFEEWNLLEPLPERAHIVRAMNILTRDHFSDRERARAILHCIEAVLPGGLFVVGACPLATPTVVEGSVYVVHEGQLVRLASLNGGSEIDDIVARTYPVVEAGAPSTALAAWAGQAAP